VTENPKPGSNEIDKAFDECWIGTDGYIKPDGARQQRAIAFQGNVRDTAGQTVTEVFVVDLPDDLTISEDGKPLMGTPTSRPAVPKGVVQRRVTYSIHGVQGPRHWLRTTPDGSLILYLAHDADGVAQIFGVAPNGGQTRQLTNNPFPVQGPFNVDPTGRYVAYVADNSVFITELSAGESQRLTARAADADKPVGAPNWSPDGTLLAFNRYVRQGSGRLLQVFLLERIN